MSRTKESTYLTSFVVMINSESSWTGRILAMLYSTPPALFGKKFRFRSADSVVDEMIALNRDYGTRHFYFVDDAMTMDRQRMEQICRRLIDEQLGFTWNMMTRIDAGFVAWPMLPRRS